MKIAIIGYGKMGRAIERIALDRQHQIVTIDQSAPKADFTEISKTSLAGVDAAIDFTTPAAALGNIAQVVGLKVPLVVGTTGWYEQEAQVRKQVEQADSAFLYASNFSIGVHIFLEIVKNAAKIINRFDSYDAAGFELHHNKKADSPSGTAITISEVLQECLERKTDLVYDRLDRQPAQNELHFASIRCGSIPGIHEVLFDSEVDTISLRHSARSRDGFALGAVLAAEWLAGRKGFFTINDFMQAMLAAK